MNKKQLQMNWDEFLRAYYHQECGGCEGGHKSFWASVIESEEWKEWKEYNFKKSTHGNWDFAENEELGILSSQHWKAFVEFIKQGEKKIYEKEKTK